MYPLLAFRTSRRRFGMLSTKFLWCCGSSSSQACPVLSTLASRIAYKYSMGIRSRLFGCHFSGLIWQDRKKDLVFLAVCFGSLSCCNDLKPPEAYMKVCETPGTFPNPQEKLLELPWSSRMTPP